MHYNPRLHRFLGTPQNSMTPEQWDLLKKGDHNVVMPTFATKEKMKYSQALKEGAVEQIKDFVYRENPDHFGRSCPFWGFYEYILWEELQIGIPVNDEYLIRKEVVDFWLESPKLWGNYLKNGSSQSRFSIRQSGPLVVTRGDIDYSGTQEKGAGRQDWKALYFTFGDRVVDHIETKHDLQILKGGNFLTGKSYDSPGVVWVSSDGGDSNYKEEVDRDNPAHYRHKQKGHHFWWIGPAFEGGNPL
jgi:hypothetical protein